MHVTNLFTTLFTNKRNEEVSRDSLLFSSDSCFSVYLKGMHTVTNYSTFVF